MINVFARPLPPEWAKMRLKYAAPLRVERVDATSSHRDYLGLENVQSWTGNLLPTDVDESVESGDYEAGTANRFHKNDVLFGKLRPYLAKAFYANKEGVCSTEFVVLKPQSGLHPQFLLYLLLSPEFVGLVDSSTFGAKMPRAKWDFIGTISIPVPSLDVQESIVNYLDQETAHIDTLIMEKKLMLDLLEEKRAALIANAVTYGLNLDQFSQDRKADYEGVMENNRVADYTFIPWQPHASREWPTIQAKFAFEISLGKMLQSKQVSPEDTEVPYIKAVNVQWNGITLDDLSTMWASPSDIEHLALRVGDLLVCEGGEVGRASTLDQEPPVGCIYQNAIHRVRSVKNDVRYLMHCLKTASESGWFDVLCNRATIAHFTVEKFRGFRIRIPNLKTQRQIANHLDRETARIDFLAREIENSVDLLKERRSALITAAVTGQIAPEDMNP